jgi:hypothetical protein
MREVSLDTFRGWIIFVGALIIMALFSAIPNTGSAEKANELSADIAASEHFSESGGMIVGIACLVLLLATELFLSGIIISRRGYTRERVLRARRAFAQ